MGFFSPELKLIKFGSFFLDTTSTSTPTREYLPDRVKQELEGIIEYASKKHHWHAVDPKRVEDCQRERLGPFFKRLLPYDSNEDTMNLAVLGPALGKGPSTDDGTTLAQIVKRDIDQKIDLSSVTMVGRSGAGKTATVVGLAKEHFVVYCVCAKSTRQGQDFSDFNFSALVRDAKRVSAALPRPRSLQERKDNELSLRVLVKNRVELEFLA